MIIYLHIKGIFCYCVILCTFVFYGIDKFDIRILSWSLPWSVSQSLSLSTIFYQTKGKTTLSAQCVAVQGLSTAARYYSRPCHSMQKSSNLSAQGVMLSEIPSGFRICLQNFSMRLQEPAPATFILSVIRYFQYLLRVTLESDGGVTTHTLQTTQTSQTKIFMYIVFLYRLLSKLNVSFIYRFCLHGNHQRLCTKYTSLLLCYIYFLNRQPRTVTGQKHIFVFS